MYVFLKNVNMYDFVCVYIIYIIDKVLLKTFYVIFCVCINIGLLYCRILEFPVGHLGRSPAQGKASCDRVALYPAY